MLWKTHNLYPPNFALSYRTNLTFTTLLVFLARSKLPWCTRSPIQLLPATDTQHPALQPPSHSNHSPAGYASSPQPSDWKSQPSRSCSRNLSLGSSVGGYQANTHRPVPPDLARTACEASQKAWWLKPFVLQITQSQPHLNHVLSKPVGAGVEKRPTLYPIASTEHTTQRNGIPFTISTLTLATF